MEGRSIQLKQRIILAVAVSLIAGLLYWVATHGFIVVALEATPDSPANFSLTKTGQPRGESRNSTNRVVKKIVAKGDYEVLASKSGENYFASVKVQGFLRATETKADFNPEKGRAFVGDNPSPCLYYTGAILVSYGCNGRLSNFQTHTPATETLPTYTSQLAVPLPGNIEGSANTPQGLFLLTQDTEEDEDHRPPHTLHKVDQSTGRVITVRGLIDLDKSIGYNITAYKEGILAYNETFTSVYYYKQFDTTPERVDLGNPPTKDMKPYALVVSGDVIAVGYSSPKGEIDQDDTASTKIPSRVVVHRNGNKETYSFDKQYAYISFCDPDRLCVVHDNLLEVYDISDKKNARLQTRIGDVSYIEKVSNGLVVVRQAEVLRLDARTGLGTVEYSLGDYTYCGLQQAANGYTLCLITSKKYKVALHIRSDATKNDSIDKKVAELLRLPEISKVTAYGNFITIVPNTGDPEYDTATGLFIENPARLKAANEAIGAAIAKSGINTTTYTIRNTTQ